MPPDGANLDQLRAVDLDSAVEGNQASTKTSPHGDSRPLLKIGGEVISTVGANIAFVLSQFIVLWLIARFSDLETVGQFGLAMAILQPVFVLGRMGLRCGHATEIEQTYALSTYLRLSLMLAVASSVLCLAALASFRPDIVALAFPLAVAKAVELVSLTLYGAFQRSGALGHMARSLVLRSVAGTGLFAILLLYGTDVEAALWAQPLIWLLVFLLHDMPARPREGSLRPSLRAHGVLRLLRTNSSLGLGQFLSVLQMSVPRILIEVMIGSAALGLFTVIAYLQQAAMTVFDAVGQVITPRLARYWYAGQRAAFGQMLRSLMALAAACSLLGGALGLALGPTMLEIAFGPDFADAGALLKWVLLTIGLRLLSAIAQSGLLSRRAFQTFGTLQATLFTLSIPCTLTLIHVGGLAGAGISLALMAAIRLLLLLFLLRQTDRIDA
ncbi:lipopolysaccharide biosynthesis protein [Pontivivens ytuae]|uniref:Lipopolysaccharide biosynthesis protein n=1 Tax=Pontivivens ytuae TaxID=2789856 RepID=A0A7S9LVN1_9RHOB|nr:lipopolysaccharide biosynthesis protein [Pontivivens ytuae]QPH55954.1 lipopolysaccharide biosynthesis protein [Pontivivens ytuae]